MITRSALVAPCRRGDYLAAPATTDAGTTMIGQITVESRGGMSG
jgi:hypothetical protein